MTSVQTRGWSHFACQWLERCESTESAEQRVVYIIHVYGHQPMVLSVNKQRGKCPPMPSLLGHRRTFDERPNTRMEPFCMPSVQTRGWSHFACRSMQNGRNPSGWSDARAREVRSSAGRQRSLPSRLFIAFCTMSGKQKSDISDSAASALLCRKKQSDISDSEVKGHHIRKPGASFFIKFHKEIRPKPDISCLVSGTWIS